MSHQNIRTKVCPKCEKEKSLDFFGRDASRSDGRYVYCKECRRNPNRKEQIVEELAAKGLKSCTLCTKPKPFSAFHSDSQKRLGLASRCKKCAKEQQALKNKEWHQSVRVKTERLDSGFHKCYKCLTVKPISSFLSSRNSKYGIFSLCLDCNNVIRREYNRKRRKSLKDYTRWEVFENDNFTCYICEEVLSPDVLSPHPKSLTIDHVVPIAKGGLDERENVRTACLDCNRHKSDLSLEDFLNRRL